MSKEQVEVWKFVCFCGILFLTLGVLTVCDHVLIIEAKAIKCEQGDFTEDYHLTYCPCAAGSCTWSCFGRHYAVECEEVGEQTCRDTVVIFHFYQLDDDDFECNPVSENCCEPPSPECWPPYLGDVSGWCQIECDEYCP